MTWPKPKQGLLRIKNSIFKNFPQDCLELWPTPVTWCVTGHSRVWQTSGSPWRNTERLGEAATIHRQGNTHSLAPCPALSLLHILPCMYTQCHCCQQLCPTFWLFLLFHPSIFPFSPPVGYPKERRLMLFAGLCGSASQDLELCLIACLYLFLFTLSLAKTTLPLPHTCCFPLIYISFLDFTLSTPNQLPFSSSFFFLMPLIPRIANILEDTILFVFPYILKWLTFKGLWVVTALAGVFIVGLHFECDWFERH